MARGISKILQSSSLHCMRSMSNKSVRLALVTSVACTDRPVSRQMRNVSTVPKRISPASHRLRSPGTVSSRYIILVAEKYGSRSRPVRRRTSSSSPLDLSRWQIGEDTLLCHTIAGATARPVARSHRIVVSRWLVMPMAATCSARVPDCSSTRWAQDNWDCQISSGSCSTTP